MMLGFNWVDIIILLLLALAVYKGLRIGFLALVLTFGGLFAALFFGGWLFPRILPISDKTLLAVVNVNLVLLFAALVAIRCFEYGRRLHISLGKGKIHALESAAGVVISVGSTLAIIWMLAAAIGALPFAGLSNSANDSFIVQALDRHLPAVPAVFEGLTGAVSPNSVPQIIIKQLPNSSIGSAPLPAATPAVVGAGASVVRITSFGCGGIVDGSGFVIAPGLVATNAHVIAGVKRPIIKYRLQSIEGVPVFFDPRLDFAILQVKGLEAPPLRIASDNAAPGTAVYAIGYPKSIYTLSPGLVRRSLHVLGKNIYGLGSFDKDIYELQINVQSGSSGGPVVTKNGVATGLIFGRASSGGDGYALSIAGLMDEIHQAGSSTTRVGTGACLAN